MEQDERADGGIRLPLSAESQTRGSEQMDPDDERLGDQKVVVKPNFTDSGMNSGTSLTADGTPPTINGTSFAADGTTSVRRMASRLCG